MKHPVVAYYTESRRLRVGQSTADHAAECLNRILDTLEQTYGIRIRVDRISDAYSKHRIDGLDGDILQHWYNSFAIGRKPATVNNYVCIPDIFIR